jgi:cytochrome c-type biogenesis protein CcmH
MPFTVDTFMTVFIAMTGTMVAVAMVFLLPPLLVPRGARQAGSLAQSNLAIYRQQMRELELDFASGTLALPQFEESKRELEQRVVAEIPSAQEPSRSIRVLSRRSALAVAVIVPVAAALLYGYLGSPQAIRTPPRP